MITDKIKFKPGFAQEDAASYNFAEVEVDNVTPERIWRNLCNISVWNRFNSSIVDIQPLDSADNDPHLFDKMQFYYDLNCGKRVMAQVIFFQHPKDDRAGRLAYQGTVMDGDKEINSITVEYMIGVPDHKGRFTLQCAKSAKSEIPESAKKTVLALSRTPSPTWLSGARSMTDKNLSSSPYKADKGCVHLAHILFYYYCPQKIRVIIKSGLAQICMSQPFGVM